MSVGSGAATAGGDTAAADVHQRDASRSADLKILLLAVVMVLACIVMVAVGPDLNEPVRSTGWWAVVVVAGLFGLFERFVFYVQFRSEAIAFSLSEIPMAFALVYLTPQVALLARVGVTLIILAMSRRSALVKLAFNAALVTFELVAAILVFRWMIGLWGAESSGLIVALAATLVVSSPSTSVIVSSAIALVEGGDWWGRVRNEFAATWWMYLVNSVLAAMTVALTLIEPWLGLLALLPTAGNWYVLRNFGEQGQQLRDLDEVHGFAGRVGFSLQVDEIAESAVGETLRLLRADAVALVRFDHRPAVVHSSGPMPLTLPSAPDDEPWHVWLGDRGVRLVEFIELRATGVGFEGPERRAIVAPVLDETGPIALVVIVEGEGLPNRFDDSDVARVKSLTEQLATSLRKGMLHQQIEYEARHDALTDLPARSLLELEITEHLSSPADGRAFVMMLDLDRFKEVNDTLGHHAGDELLIEFSRRISTLLEPGEMLARLAGDEFAIFGCRRDGDAIADLARACVREGARPVTIDGLEIVVTVSVGVAELLDIDVDAIQPMRRADIAMYNAKWQRSGVEIYRDEIDRRTPARLSMLGDLQSALESDGLYVVYQPKLDLVSGRVVGAEALVRWHHESRGHVSPADFVRVAEDTGLIKQLTDLVLARGIATLRMFHEAGLDIGLAVNLSTHDLLDSRLPDRVSEYLSAHGVDPARLTLEITESSLLVDVPRTRGTIDDLNNIGVRMAIDDFGTGYSSLSYLRRLPVSELKIDQSFVMGLLTDEQDDVIVRSTVDLGHNLGLQVVAEGVESVAVMNRLRSMGCDVAQGYCISRPVPADEMIEWLGRVDAAHIPQEPTAWVGAV